MRVIERPSNAAIERIAQHSPGLLNVLYAYFVMGWYSVRAGTALVPHSGVDFSMAARRLPDYVSALGVDSVVRALFQCPPRRAPDEPGGIEILAEIHL